MKAGSTLLPANLQQQVMIIIKGREGGREGEREGGDKEVLSFQHLSATATVHSSGPPPDIQI